MPGPHRIEDGRRRTRSLILATNPEPQGPWCPVCEDDGDVAATFLDVPGTVRLDCPACAGPRLPIWSCQRLPRSG